MREQRRRERVFGERGPRRVWPIVALTLAMVLSVAALGFLLVALLRAGMAGGSPLLTALCLGGVMITFMATAIVLLRVAARHLGDGSTARRAITLGGLAVLMGCAPFLMILVVYLLTR